MASFLCRSTSSHQGEIHYHETPGGGGGMLKDSCQRVILAGETFEGFVAVETRILRYFKRSNFEI